MQADRPPVLTGGCQCGAVRYAFYAEPSSADICHCRMCQKAMGNLFMASASVPHADFAWTAGAPAIWQSSAIAERGFCAACGTPLSFRYLAGERISVTTGSLDQPARARPTAQLGVESRVPWFHELAGLPESRTEDHPPPGGVAAVQSRQHPDREP
ncbi:MAG TPA: GFA family protein [Geminicoccaceae bacterium]|nr:GFA family protein [Geminicoccaceae bacterium]